jgi:hypothetical protein
LGAEEAEQELSVYDYYWMERESVILSGRIFDLTEGFFFYERSSSKVLIFFRNSFAYR